MSSFTLSFRVFLRLGPRVLLCSHLFFSTGSTTELDAMVRYTVDNYPNTKLLGVGFSLGGNILVKYLGENPEHQRNFICAISLCQGYDILK
jgi:predicted alpha/beta-fold hydrolase